MKTIRSFFRLSCLLGGLILLSGCEGKTETFGDLPNIKLTGSVLGGALQNAEVIMVGINSNGQPELTGTTADADFTGERLYTDHNGFFDGYINGAYSGPLLVVARATSKEGEQTFLKCGLQQGCRDSDGATVAFGERYVVPDDFEIWGLHVGVKQGDRIDLTWLTHIAAKLAYTTYVSDGTACDEDNCVGQTPVKGFINSQTAFKANDQVKNLFGLTQSASVLSPWHPATNSVQVSEVDSAILAQQTRHGLLALLLEQVAKDNNENLDVALARIETEFLSLGGQFYQDRAGATSLSLKAWLTWALAEAQAIDDAGRGQSGVVQVIAELQTQLNGSFTVNALTTAVGEDYLEDLSDRISAARDFIQNATVWVGDLGSQQYASYFGDDVAAGMARFDGLWQSFKPVMVEGLQDLYWLQMDFAEYAMTCVRGGLSANHCDTSHAMHANSTYTPATATLTYSAGDTTLVAKIEAYSEESEYFFRITFSNDLALDTNQYRVTSTRNDENIRAYIQVGLNKPLSTAEAPYIVALGVFYPNLLVRAKNPDGSCCDTDVRLSAENVIYEAVGTKDVTDDQSPVRYNMLSLSLPAVLRDSGNDSVELLMIVNSDASSASLYYPEQKYPELNIRLDVEAFRKFARLELDGQTILDDLDTQVSSLGGWFISRNDIPANDQILNSVEYTESSNSADLDSALLEVLNLPSNAQEFEIGGFNYPGGETKLAIWRDPNSTEPIKLATQCLKSKGLWSCTANQYLQYLGCNEGSTLGNATAGILESLNFLRDEGCLPQVLIEGRGVYNIDYTNGGADVLPFTEGQAFHIGLEDKLRLEVNASSFRLVTRFYDASGNLMPIANFTILGQALIQDGDPIVTMSASLTAGYKGTSPQNTNGLDLIIPYGERNLWVALGSGQNAAVQDEALAYYIQNGNVTLTLKGFDALDGTGDLGVVRYAGSLIGTVRREGNVFVVRYVDNSWQLL